MGPEGRRVRPDLGTAPIIEGQTEDVRHRLDTAIDVRLAAYASDGQLELPVVVQLVHGVKR